MSERVQLIQTLYEISLSIGPKETLAATADDALAAYLQKLNCSVGAVLERRETDAGVSYEPIVTIPETNPLLTAGMDRLDQAQPDEVPLSGQLADGSHYYVMALPGVGALVLGKRGGELTDKTLSALEPLNEKLAEACENKRIERQLREERDRFEAVVGSIPEPVANVVVEDGTHRVTRVNTAFEGTFGDRQPPAEGTDIRTVVQTADAALDYDWLESQLADGETVTQPITGETVDGNGDFIFCGVPVDRSERLEYFAIYVDISDQKARERKLERLYWGTEAIIPGDDREAISERTLETIQRVLEPAHTAVHCYERDDHVLELIAATPEFDAAIGETSIGASDESPLWDVYVSGESAQIDDWDGPGTETSGLVFPLGAHGVVTLLETEPEGFDDYDVYYTRLLSTVVTTALDREQNERGLTNVQRAVRATANQDSHEEMVETILEWLPDALDLPVAGIWRYSAPEGALEPLGVTDRGGVMFDEPPTFSGDGSIAWKQFVAGESTLVRDVPAHPATYNAETTIGSEIVAPIGEFGILVAGSPREDDFSDLDAEIMDTLATNLETVTRLIDRRQEIQLLDQVLARILRHNLRNKLTTIRGYADIIERTSDDAVATNAAKIVNSCIDLEKTAEHAQEMREIVQNRSDSRRLSLAETARLAVEAVRSECPAASIELAIEESWEVVAHTRLQTAIGHLVRNGVEHAVTDRPEVTVTVGSQNGAPMVTVADDGPGIPAHEVEILAERQESSLAHGSGAGLWIVDRVVEYSDAVLAFDVTDGTSATIVFPAHNSHSGST